MKKVYVILYILLLLALPTVFADLNQGLIHAIPFSESTGNFYDAITLDQNNTACDGVTRRVGCINGNCVGSTVNDDSLSWFNTSKTFNVTTPYTYSLWYKSTDVIEDGAFLNFGDSNSSAVRWINNNETGGTDIYDGATQMVTTVGFVYGSWNLYLVTGDGTNNQKWINGVNVVNDSSMNENDYSDLEFFGQYPESIDCDFAGGIIADIDEFYFWNRQLSNSEISDLYNSGTGYFYPFNVPAGTVTPVLLYPLNGSINNTNSYLFQYNVSIENNLTICELWDNTTGIWKKNQSNTTAIVNNSINNFTKNIDIDGSYKWNVNCSIQNGSSYWSINGNFTLKRDIVQPTITDNINNATILFNRNLTGQINFSDNNLFRYNITIDGASINYTTNISGLTFFSYNLSYNTTNLSGWHTLGIEVADGHTSNMIDNYIVDDGLFNNQLKYTTKINTITISEKDGSLLDRFTTKKETDRYTFDYIPNTLATSYTFIIDTDKEIYILNDPKTDYKTWIVSGNNWIDFYSPENKNAKVTITRLKKNQAEVRITDLDIGEKIGFQSVGDLNTNQINYSFFVANYTIGYERKVLVNQLNTIGLNLTLPSGTSANVSLWYNNTQYYLGTDINTSTTKTSPNVSGLNEDTSLNFTVEINGINGSTYNYNQTVYNFFLDNCSSYNTSVLNISYFDEGNYSVINIDTTGVFNYSKNNIYKTYNLNQVATNRTTICMYPNFTSINNDLDLAYSSAYFPSRNYFNNSVFTNVTQLLNLYSLIYTDGIYANFNIVNSAGQVVSGVLGEMEKSVNSSYILVETELSDDVGSMAFWEDPDIYYRYTFSKERCVEQSFVLRRTTSDTYTVTMNCGGTSTTSNPSYALGINYSFEPSNTMLSNGTGYDFVFNLGSSFWDITACSATLLNQTGSTITTATGTFSTTVCTVSFPTYTTGQKSTSLTLRGEYTLNSSSTLYVTQPYSVEYRYTGAFSLKTLLDDLKDFGMNGFNAATRMILAFIITFILIAYLSYQFNISEPETLIGMLIMCVWLFSYIGWIYLDYSQIPLEILRKYLLAIIITLAGGSYIIKKVID